MDTMTPLESAAHRQAFTSTGTYSIEKNEINLTTEIPITTLSYEGSTYSLKLKKCYNISSTTVPCILAIYNHGHPNDRRVLASDDLKKDEQKILLNTVFKDTNFPQEKIFVITMHDEDFKEEHLSIYRFYVEHHVAFDAVKEDYDRDLKPLEEFINGKFSAIISEEEPRTVGGGVLDPAN